MRLITALTVGALAALAATSAFAEAARLRVAKQYGLGYVQLMMMEDAKLIEKHAKAAGLGDVAVEWSTFRSSDVVNDALISGNLDFASLGPTAIVTLWSRTRGSMDVRVASGLNAMAWMLNVRDPRIKSIRDFSDNDRIAVPAVKVSGQATALEIAAAREWGIENYDRLDKLTVSLAHPDATAMMLGGPSEIVANFSSPPYEFIQKKDPRVRTLLTSDDILGGPISFNVLATTKRFRDDNPKLYKAFLDALEEATAAVNADKGAAADVYARMSGDKTPKAEIVAMMNDATSQFTTETLGLGAFTDFMAKVGRVKVAPKDWRTDLLFPEAQARLGK